MKRPDVQFRVNVCETFRVYSCAVKLEQESRGVFGCHGYHKCPDCRVEPEGYELWGENGHHQASAKDRQQLARVLRYSVMRQFRMRDGRLMGNVIRRGAPQYYVGGAA